MFKHKDKPVENIGVTTPSEKQICFKEYRFDGQTYGDALILFGEWLRETNYSVEYPNKMTLCYETVEGGKISYCVIFTHYPNGRGGIY
jgi:hypothetical protein